MAQFDKALSAPGTSGVPWIRLTVSGGVQKIDKNITPVRWIAWVEMMSSVGYPWDLNPYGSASVMINGVRVLSKTGLTYDFRNDNRKLMLGSGWLDVVHNSDGTKTISCAAAYNDPGNGIGTGQASGMLDLRTIPRGPRVRVGGTWKPTIAYVRVGGSWKTAIPYVRVGGTWKIGGG